MNGWKMKIAEIVNEGRELNGKKLELLVSTDINSYDVRNKSREVRETFLKGPRSHTEKTIMKGFLFRICSLIHVMFDDPRWDEWLQDPGMKMIAREMQKIYDDNIDFMKKYG